MGVWPPPNSSPLSSGAGRFGPMGPCLIHDIPGRPPQLSPPRPCFPPGQRRSVSALSRTCPRRKERLVHTDQAIAEKAAADLRGYWAERGYAVRAEIECTAGPVGSKDGLHLYLIRTDLINGMPRGFRAQGFKVKAPTPKEKV